jgi:hypothetical protein
MLAYIIFDIVDILISGTETDILKGAYSFKLFSGGLHVTHMSKPGIKASYEHNPYASYSNRCLYAQLNILTYCTDSPLSYNQWACHRKCIIET